MKKKEDRVLSRAALMRESLVKAAENAVRARDSLAKELAKLVSLEEALAEADTARAALEYARESLVADPTARTIVGWLRSLGEDGAYNPHCVDPYVAREIAEAIERGDHDR